MSAPPLETKENKVSCGEFEVQPEEFKVLSNPVEIRHWYINLINSAKSEISLIIATPNALRRNLSGGMINLLREAADKREVMVRLIVPAEEDQIHKAEDSFQRIGLMPTSHNFEIKKILPMTHRTSQIKSTFLIVDKQTSFIIDVKDDTRENLIEAVGFASYYRSGSRAESYSYVFDTIWRQAELYESLAQANKSLNEANKKLELQDAMEKEFINIAAHELRTPAQAIIGYSEMLKSFPDRRQQYEEAISRNAVRLYALVTDMLDVARIESQTLKIERTSFDLNQKIENVIKDIKQQKSSEYNKVKIFFEPDKPITIYADKARIFQVLANLLNNALKFTTEGVITVSATRNDGTKEAMITITDSGTGIDPEILPHLFSKFKSKSEKGLGLGLYIAKNIVEAHGGEIGAHNNTNGKGATFSVKIPLNGSR